MNTNNTNNNILNLVPKYGNDAVQVKETANNWELGTRKLKAQCLVDIGKDQTILAVSETLPVTIVKDYETGSRELNIRMSIAALLTIATNGLFELVNNCKESNFGPLGEALENGYFYSSSYEMSKKANPFSWAEFVTWLKEQPFDNALRPKVEKFLNLTTKQMASLTTEQLEKVGWLYPLLLEKGYQKPTPASNSLLDDLI